MWAVHLMFGMPILETSTGSRTGVGEWVGEFVSIFDLIVTVVGTSTQQPNAIAVARALSDSLAGIPPADMPGFIAVQLAGALADTAVATYLFPKGPAVKGMP